MNELTERLKDLYKIQKKIDDLTDEKNKLKKDVEDLIVEQKLEGKKFSIGDRCISYSLKTTTQSITQKYLASALDDYYRNNSREAERVLEHILNNRPKSQKYQLDMIKQKQN